MLQHLVDNFVWLAKKFSLKVSYHGRGVNVNASVAYCTANHIYITLILWLLGIYGSVNHLALHGLSGFTAINP